MISARFTKAAIEQEEGMTHLWIRLASFGRGAHDLRLRLDLPAGLHRLPNSGGLPETETGDIVIPEPWETCDIVVELFTRERVPAGNRSVVITAVYHNREDANTRIEHAVPLRIAEENETDGLTVDKEALDYVQEVLRRGEAGRDRSFVDYTRTKVIRQEPGPYSDWEKKYRIEGFR